MSFDAGSLFASLLISSIGFVLLAYGKKQARLPQVATGLTMMIYPYFVPGALWMSAVAAALLGLLALLVKLGY
jgi:hypothetical protein